MLGCSLQSANWFSNPMPTPKFQNTLPLCGTLPDIEELGHLVPLGANQQSSKQDLCLRE